MLTCHTRWKFLSRTYYIQWIVRSMPSNQRRTSGSRKIFARSTPGLRMLASPYFKYRSTRLDSPVNVAFAQVLCIIQPRHRPNHFCPCTMALRLSTLSVATASPSGTYRAARASLRPALSARQPALSAPRPLRRAVVNAKREYLTQ